jgi:uncharacterized phage-associated protein
VTSVHNVAAYTLAKRGQMPIGNLNRLLYYTQAWHLVWDDEALFAEAIHARGSGPTIHEIVDATTDFMVREWSGDAGALTANQIGTVDAVLGAYGDLTGRQLGHLIHGEAPWRDARRRPSSTERGDREISHEAMRDYYRAVAGDPNAQYIEDVEWPEGWRVP